MKLVGVESVKKMLKVLCKYLKSHVITSNQNYAFGLSYIPLNIIL